MSKETNKWIGAVAVVAMLGWAAPVLVADEALDKAFEALKTFDWGQKMDAIRPIEDAVLKSHGDAAAQKALAARLAAVLKTDATRRAKDLVCRKLSLIGCAESVPALARLLTDPELSHMGRYALERMRCEPSVKALRSALPKVKGKLKVGVINSLGVRRDAASTKALVALLGDSDGAVIGAAATALGSIGTPEAAKALCAMQGKAKKGLRVVVTDACLGCAERLLANGKAAEAKKIYTGLDSPDQPEYVRLAAKLGLKAASGK